MQLQYLETDEDRRVLQAFDAMRQPRREQEFARFSRRAVSLFMSDAGTERMEAHIRGMSDAQVNAVSRVLDRGHSEAVIRAPWLADTAPALFPFEVPLRAAVFAIPAAAAGVLLTQDLNGWVQLGLVGAAAFAVSRLHAFIQRQVWDHESRIRVDEPRDRQAYAMLETGLGIPHHQWRLCLLGLVEVERRRREAARQEAADAEARAAAAAQSRAQALRDRRRIDLVRDFQGRFGMTHSPEARMHPGPYGFSPVTGLPLSAPGVEFDGTPVGVIARRLGVSVATLATGYGLANAAAGNAYVDADGVIVDTGSTPEISPFTGIQQLGPGLEFDGSPLGCSSISTGCDGFD